MGTTIINCNCKTENDFQDKTYGKFKRLANKTSKTEYSYRCTICNREVEAIKR